MPHAVFLRGVNVGGHKTFRPTELVRQLAHLDIVNIGAAGTFVVRSRVSRADLRDALARALPFDTEIMICEAREIRSLVAADPFAGQPQGADVVQFVSVLAQRPRTAPPLPVTLPPRGPWLLRIIGAEGKFVLGLYRRQMKAISLLGTVDRLFGATATTRNWNTMVKVAEAAGHQR